MPVKVGDGERESVVDADEGWSLVTKLVAEPFGETTARPVPQWAGRRLKGLANAAYRK
jgi:hypothetical protein